MKLVHVPMIDEERIAAYIDGTLSPEEKSAFNNDMAHDDALAAFVSDFKTDLDIVDNGITLEQYEPNFDPVGAVDGLFDSMESFSPHVSELEYGNGSLMEKAESYIESSQIDSYDTEDHYGLSEDISTPSSNDTFQDELQNDTFNDVIGADDDLGDEFGSTDDMVN